MATIELEDFSAELAEMNADLEIDPAETAIVTIDMHRGHLDPELATMPAPREVQDRVVTAAARLLRAARAKGIPVVHVVLQWRPEEYGKYVMRRPGGALGGILLSKAVTDDPTPALRDGVKHNLVGSRQTEVMPELWQDGDFRIDNKKTLSPYRGTDLELLLRGTLGVRNVILMGINTNTCVQNSGFDTLNLGFRPIFISDCMGSMYGEDLHLFGLQNAARCLGWVLNADEFLEKIDATEEQQYLGEQS